MVSELQHTNISLQDGVVELGLLGCPNLPKDEVADDDGGPAAMSRAADTPADWGALFLGVRGHGAYVSALNGSQVEGGMDVFIRVAVVGRGGMTRAVEVVRVSRMPCNPALAAVQVVFEAAPYV
jgi:hypothetical protein